jgi:hypothetical protein
LEAVASRGTHHAWIATAMVQNIREVSLTVKAQEGPGLLLSKVY